MAGANKQEYTPLLPAGFHDFDVVKLRRLCVARFPHSITRQSIMGNLEAVLSLLQNKGMKGEVWIDGSFTTEKLNPGDVDLLLVTNVADYRALAPQEKQFFEWFSKTSLHDTYQCDNYGMIRDDNHPESDWMLAYWLRQFGWSRGNEMKGLAVIKLPFLVRP